MTPSRVKQTIMWDSSIQNSCWKIFIQRR